MFCHKCVFQESLSENKVMYVDYISKKVSLGGVTWCVLGDFNSTRSSDERFGVGVNSNFFGIMDFKDFSNFIS